MELAKLLVSILTPLAIVAVGYFIQRAMANQSQSWKRLDRLVDKRVDVYEKIAEDLNRIHCYVLDIGGFKQETPETILAAKRNVDRQMFIYRAIWPPETFAAFLRFIESSFEHFQGIGRDAKIRTTFVEKKTAYERKGETWPAGWDEWFTKERDVEHKRKHDELIERIADDLNFPVKEER